MTLRTRWNMAARHGMRAYYVPAAAGILLTISAFLPWIRVGEHGIGGVPDMGGLWILALGVLATLFACLSIVTRKNSRHPLLVVGLMALGIMVLAQRVMIRSAAGRAWAASEARAIVEGERGAAPHAGIGAGMYLGLAASAVLVLFGLTIVVKRVAQPYAVPEDDDV